MPSCIALVCEGSMNDNWVFKVELGCKLKMKCNAESREVFNSMVLPFKWLMRSQLATET